MRFFIVFLLFLLCFGCGPLAETTGPDGKPRYYRMPAKPVSTPDVIYLSNPSFEGDAEHQTVPVGWQNFGAVGMTPPDTQPGQFGVKLPPHHGWTYLGMVYRDIGTTEIVGQKLDLPLQAGETYSFELWLAASHELASMSLKTKQHIYYDAPVSLRILSLDGATQEVETLAKSEPIEHTDWRKYTFTLKPTRTADHLLLKCQHPMGEALNGCLLLDGCSEIRKILEK